MPCFKGLEGCTFEDSPVCNDRFLEMKICCFQKSFTEARKSPTPFGLLERFVRWPKGKYNGQRIDGFKLSFHLHILWWNWKPVFKLNYGEPYFIWLCFSVRGYLSFAT